MITYGCIWLYMVLHGVIWFYMVVYGSIGFYIYIYVRVICETRQLMYIIYIYV